MAKALSYWSFVAVLGLGVVLSALVLLVVVIASSGYVLGEPRIVVAISVGGPLLAFATWSVLALVQRGGAGHSQTGEADRPGTPHHPPAERGGEPTGEPRSVAHQLILLACGVALSIPVGLTTWLVLNRAASPLLGAAHPTELGTTWHDNDRTVRLLIGLALAVVGCVFAKVLVRAGGARLLAIGLAAGCIVMAVLLGLAK